MIAFFGSLGMLCIRSHTLVYTKLVLISHTYPSSPRLRDVGHLGPPATSAAIYD